MTEGRDHTDAEPGGGNNSARGIGCYWHQKS